MFGVNSTAHAISRSAKTAAGARDNGFTCRWERSAPVSVQLIRLSINGVRGSAFSSLHCWKLCIPNPHKFMAP